MAERGKTSVTSGRGNVVNRGGNGKDYTPAARAYTYSVKDLATGYDAWGNRLSEKWRAYRSGYVQHAIDSADVYNYNNNRVEPYARGLEKKADKAEKTAAYHNKQSGLTSGTVSTRHSEKADKAKTSAGALRIRANEVCVTKQTKRPKR
jgi:hypothetical protein